MGLNIKRPATETAIRQLADLDGISLTDAVEVAVEEAIARRQAGSEKAKFDRDFEDLMRFLEKTAPAPPLPPGARSNHDELYGEDGLPA